MGGKEKIEASTLPDKASIDTTLDAICASDGFAAAQRLQDFLRYVVMETFEGRGAQIFGKTIAEDVYKRAPDKEGDSSNLVRVDARRLRRALEDYYAGPGESDRIRIHIDPGQYAARFEIAERRTSAAPSPSLWRLGPVALAMGATAILAIAIFSLVHVFVSHEHETVALSPPAQPAEVSRKAKREAFLEKSPASVHAFNLTEQARNFYYPELGKKPLAEARALYENAIKLDTHYFGAHAGLAQVVGFQSFHLPPGEERDALVDLAEFHAMEAEKYNAADAWTQSALAWAAFARRDISAARIHSARAMAIAPADLFAVDFDALISVLSGDYMRTISVTDPARYADLPLDGHLFQICVGVAKFHLGDFTGAVAAIERNMETGGPSGPINFAYLIAANQKAGDQEHARQLLEQFQATWPTSRFDLFLYSFFMERAPVDDLVAALTEAGWKPPET
ncbi:hypothetical protein [Labrenzia sp. CE80]|uniref:hypothetical protein n=1 Tax=Labrenzia sp. CE80 TaxID=1788986 RepID=UPI00129B5063|nr:hypothetical protein [Labrenzia sp. CE80]